MGFLERIADKFLSQYGKNLHQLVFVFPTRRARLYFRRYLQLKKSPESAIWEPRTFSIADFIAQLSGLEISDQLDLIFQLYAVYRKHAGNFPKEFEEFYPWGKMIVADFDEIDKHLVDTRVLFRILEEFKGIEDFTNAEKSDIYERYTGFWQDLQVIYREFRNLLSERNQAYEGMVYRAVAEKVQEYGDINRLDGEKTIFCGFNALTKAEEIITSHLLSENKAEIYWDMDRYFVEDRNQEAGHFFRKNMETLGSRYSDWVDDHLTEEKKINIIGVQSNVSQAKVLGIKLRELKDYLTDPASTAVVLPDEKLLFPVLNSLPADVEAVNVTIGFPLRQTPVFSLFDGFMEMQLQALETRQRTSRHESDAEFYYKHVRNLLNHPYIKSQDPEKINNLLADIQSQNLIYIKKRDVVLPKPVLRELFDLQTSTGKLLNFFLRLLDAIREFYRENKPDLFSVDYEYIYHFYTLISRLRDSLEKSDLVLDIHTFRKLFFDIVQGTRIPFTGEPLMGLQIMGVLETQTLDFNHLFVLSLNEGYLPPGKTQQSFIPFEVRVHFGLPTYKERDAVAAYHFYRLLKNSKNITLLYITEARGIEKKEKSRFIDQVLIEYAERNKKAVIDHQVIDFSFEAQEVKAIYGQKTSQVLKELTKKSYSASSLLTYLTCPLQFYFTYILKLHEEEEMIEGPDYRLVGDVIHKTLQELYKPFMGTGQPVTFKDIDSIKKNIEATLTPVFIKKLKSTEINTGRNRVVYEVIKKFLNNFVEKEKQESGFKILMLEERVVGEGFKFSLSGKDYLVKLEGTIDRLDMKENIYRLIDYKTGKIGSLNIKSQEEFIEQLSGQEAVNRKEVFQLLFYRFLLKHTGSNHGTYKLGIYPFKKLYDELKFVKVDRAELIDDQSVELFEEILKEIFEEMFNPDVSFVQTTEEKNCRYCPYRSICNREEGISYLD